MFSLWNSNYIFTGKKWKERLLWSLGGVRWLADVVITVPLSSFKEYGIVVLFTFSVYEPAH